MTAHAVAVEILRRRGMNLDEIPKPSTPRFDLIEWRHEQARQILDGLVPAKYNDAQPDHPQVAHWVRQFLADSATASSLLLVGPTGVGKTRQMFGALKVVLSGRAKEGRGLVFRVTSQPDLNDALRPKPDGSHAFALEPLLTADLLLLDDLGAGKQTEWTGDSLYRLVDHRWSHSLPSIYSTNLNAAALTDAVGDRVVSRLADAIRVTITGTDRRWEK